jgi:hypothetical protein
MKTTMQEKDYLTICINELEKKVKWGNRNEWTNFHFTTLSSQISSVSGIIISISSVRRLMGQDKFYKKEYNPQMGTKNALAQYLGYLNWADFKLKNKKNGIHFNEKPDSFIRFLTISLLFIALLGPVFYFNAGFIHSGWFFFAGTLYGVLLVNEFIFKQLTSLTRKMSTFLWKIIF